jgi:predicted TIM-barrel fold metal-dependent hydrolase
MPKVSPTAIGSSMGVLAPKQSNGRLRWAAPLPLITMKALEELRWVRDHGACAVFVKSIEGDRQLIDPYFYPLYEEAQKLDVPICVHASIVPLPLAARPSFVN